jgi:hypothetical protein
MLLQLRERDRKKSEQGGQIRKLKACKDGQEDGKETSEEKKKARS